MNATLARDEASATLDAAFGYDARRLALAYTSGELTLAEWHSAALVRVRLHAIAQFRLAAAGRRARVADLERVLYEQSAYLQTFAAQLALAEVDGRSVSAGYLAARLDMYRGAGRALYYQTAERAEGGRYRYVALDDGGTCGPCLDAQGEYPAGQGPMPGEVCLGRGRCRCRREPISGG